MGKKLNMKKKSSRRLFLAHSAAGQETTFYLRMAPLHRENDQKDSLSGKAQEIWKLCQNTGNMVYSSCKFPDSKDKAYCDIGSESQFRV